MIDCLIGLGSNLGDRRAVLERAAQRLAAAPGVTLLARSRWHRTRPVGGPPGQEAFLNGALRLQTVLPPDQLWKLLRETELGLGRRRAARWGPRSVDLDLLLYGNQVLRAADLEVPHPRMSFRRFVLEPAAEIAADMRHPLIGWTIGELLAHVQQAPSYVAVAGPIAVGKTWLAEELERAIGAQAVRERLAEIPLDAFYADPAGRAWHTELRFLDQRREQLDFDGDAAAKAAQGVPVVSDYWFDQSLVYAGVWLDPEQLARFEPLWREAAARVMRPRLLVVLEGPTELLQQRIAERGRPYEQRLPAARLEALRTALESYVARGGHGPILRLSASQPEQILSETRAAIEAMQ